MDSSSTRWQVMGQQVMMGPLNLQPLSFLPPFYPNDDQWDGYPYERQRIWDTVLTNNIQNFVVLTGDIHTAWAMDLPARSYNGSTGAGSAGVEFVATSVTSSGSPLPISQSIIQSANPHIKYADLTNHGYVLLDINKNRTQGEFWYVNTISTRGGTESYNRGYFVNNGERNLRQSTGMSMPSPNMIGIKSPLFPRGYNPSCNTTSVELNENNRESVLLGVYPNPFNSEIMIQLTLNQNVKTTAIVYDLMGREVAKKEFGELNAGIYELPLNLDNLNSGAYIVVLKMGERINQRKIVKAN